MRLFQVKFIAADAVVAYDIVFLVFPFAVGLSPNEMVVELVVPYVNEVFERPVIAIVRVCASEDFQVPCALVVVRVQDVAVGIGQDFPLER